MAFANKDYDECINSFLDILDYKDKENQLKPMTLNKIIYSNKMLIKDSIFVEIFEVKIKKFLKYFYTYKIESYQPF